MKMGDKFRVEGWPTGIYPQKKKAWLGEIGETWKYKGYPFFTLRHCDQGIHFIGAICSERCELSSLIADEVKGKINGGFITMFHRKLLNVVVMINNGTEYIAFLAGIPEREDTFYTIEGKKKRIEEIFEEAIKRFDEKKERIKNEKHLFFQEG